MHTKLQRPRPHKAIILAAGFGTRLLPLTRTVPKPLLPLGGVPMLDRAIALAERWGVRDLVINLHHGAPALLRHLLDRPPGRARINLSFEPDILGTGGALTRAAWFLNDESPFWILNADVAADLDGRKLLRAFRPGETIAAAWLTSTRGPRTVACTDGTISTFATPTPGAPGTYTFCGVHLVDPRILNYLPPCGFASIITAYEEARREGWRVAGVPVEDAFWADIGTPAQYVEANRQLAPSARTHDATTVRISRGVILGPGVPERDYAGIMALRAEDALEPVEQALARAWSPRGSLIACPLAPRGSARRFTRLYAGARTAMLVTHDPARAENACYTGHARFLAALDLPVPAVLAEDARHAVALFEDVGAASVQDLAPRKTGRWLEHLYERVIDALVRFHEQGHRTARQKRLPLMPSFDAKLYAWEHALFIDHYLARRGDVTATHRQTIQRELRTVARRLHAARPVLVHRDLQSSNLLVRGTRWALIDFQGMRFGPAVYDLASLLCDPYIQIAPDLRLRLLERYARQADPASRVMELFWPAAVQRLAQALGAYARLGASRETERFLAYIPPARARLHEALTAGGLRAPGLRELG